MKTDKKILELNEAIKNNEILTSEEASHLIGIHPETLRQLIKRKIIRASKCARWKFIKADLLEDMRSLYNKEKVTDKITGKITWVSTNQVNIGELELPHRMEEEYNAALGRPTKNKPSNSMTK